MEPVNRQPSSPLLPGFAGAIDTLLSRRTSDGGFAEIPDGDYRPDATAWVILCLESFRTHPGIVAGARAKLAAAQLPNGSIPLAPDYPEAFWPTAAAVMALQGAPHYSTAHGRAVDFLLATTGHHSPKDPESPVGHDSSIPGWPWINQTHPWVEPTALSIRALSLAGKTTHERVQFGVRLLLDRQLPGGGWNYGNTTVFEKILRPMPVSTGMALWSLAGLTERKTVAASIDMLKQQAFGLRTPLSLGWALHGLAAWEVAPREADTMITDCLQRQGRYSFYGTSQLGVLLTAAVSLKEAKVSHA